MLIGAASRVCGIDPAVRERIFEPFFTKKKMGRSGTGLGMAVVWGTVQDHPGYIDVQSAEGRGTEVTAFLPATRAESLKPPPANSLDSFKGAGETVLVLDDMKEQREIAAKIIEQLGYVAKSVESGEQAVELLAAREGAPKKGRAVKKASPARKTSRKRAAATP